MTLKKKVQKSMFDQSWGNVLHFRIRWRLKLEIWRSKFFFSNTSNFSTGLSSTPLIYTIKFFFQVISCNGSATGQGQRVKSASFGTPRIGPSKLLSWEDEVLHLWNVYFRNQHRDMHKSASSKKNFFFFLDVCIFKSKTILIMSKLIEQINKLLS